MAASIDTTAVGAIVIGLGATIAAMVFPTRFPNAPKWAIEASWWGGWLFVAGGSCFLAYEWGLSDLKIEPTHLVKIGLGGAALCVALARRQVAEIKDYVRGQKLNVTIVTRFDALNGNIRGEGQTRARSEMAMRPPYEPRHGSIGARLDRKLMSRLLLFFNERHPMMP